MHCFVVHVRNEIGLELLLDFLSHLVVSVQAAVSNEFSLLEPRNNFILLDLFELLELLLLSLFFFLLPFGLPLTGQLTGVRFATHGFSVERVSGVRCDRGGIGVLKPKVVGGLIVIKLLFALVVLFIYLLKFWVLKVGHLRSVLPPLVQNVIPQEALCRRKHSVFSVEPCQELGISNQMLIFVFLCGSCLHLAVTAVLVLLLDHEIVLTATGLSLHLEVLFQLALLLSDRGPVPLLLKSFVVIVAFVSGRALFNLLQSVGPNLVFQGNFLIFFLSLGVFLFIVKILIFPDMFTHRVIAGLGEDRGVTGPDGSDHFEEFLFKFGVDQLADRIVARA